ncbi:Uncharacterised protein [BD1-7 clade bacterium]|uniref:Sulfotransferase family protein n=1 Tax=BD1-7 clade bacterium TaxID=2029982 RepID=A0A5S9QNH4_9GAMM|nr:Uncharacterised protein [BD1-7 clade bacterium]CAA0121443.1 Uncharacterised protein [BD1-7 clade bacterium]
MLLNSRHNIAFLCNPKCASTSIEAALDDHCDVRMSKYPSIKHMNARVFHESFLPMYQQLIPNSQIETVCLMRDPIDWLFSWYRYRSRPALASIEHPRHRNYTGNIDFNQFIEAYLLVDDLDGGSSDEKKAPAYAQVGSQYNFIKDSNNDIGIDRIYPLERTDLLVRYLQKKLQTRLTLEKLNQSPTRNLRLAPSLKHDLQEHLKADFRLYEQVMFEGCYRR